MGLKADLPWLWLDDKRGLYVNRFVVEAEGQPRVRARRLDALDVPCGGVLAASLKPVSQRRDLMEKIAEALPGGEVIVTVQEMAPFPKYTRYDIAFNAGRTFGRQLVDGQRLCYEIMSSTEEEETLQNLVGWQVVERLLEEMKRAGVL